MNKSTIFEKIRDNLNETLAQAEKNRDDAQAEANKHVGRMQSRYDTFKEEAQYLVTAHEARIAELRMALAQIQTMLEHVDTLEAHSTVRIGSVVLIEADTGTQRLHLLSPAGGGIQIENEGKALFVLTPDAPLGKLLLGKEEGDEVELRIGDKKTPYTILEIR